ncbi:sulfotransferase [Limnoraphis robusta Tam1]|uniref:Sulfotransferase n=1 Tax=Limnoraphis robusta CCNP1315 TaxID=3110306 RepID=A0ABU5U1Y5_9CYAN|nr:sulfotransferase [Limnoraphis robusta]MEA5500064.1 sulfotransferase [Limnoraphis robusta BA-68 BA1]MEA5521210.1 sulfotransferase [Limnoraphis robusta CCNP1315]MEA5541195.1 sulfotransferase [Limnoraphis robusta Tam1]MEA5548990.1 sulfotransferase [Limnoraphis robusta CCNP1324]
MNSQSFQPFFLVGCPRSGTTLLQSLLAAHPKITSFPESHFFTFADPKYEPKRKALGLISKRIKPVMKNYFTQEIQRPEMLNYFSPLPWVKPYSKSFIKIMMQLTEEQGNTIWLEKTPEHIYHLNLIERVLPSIQVIHLVRNGIDVIASLFEATHKYPKAWRSAKDIDSCIQDWVTAIEITKRYLDNQNHIVVRYENLVDSPEKTLESLCNFMGLNYTQEMIENYAKVSQKFVFEQGGRTVNLEIKSANSQKFYTIFDEAQQQYIKEQIAQVNLESLNQRSL